MMTPEHATLGCRATKGKKKKKRDALQLVRALVGGCLVAAAHRKRRGLGFHLTNEQGPSFLLLFPSCAHNFA